MAAVTGANAVNVYALWCSCADVVAEEVEEDDDVAAAAWWVQGLGVALGDVDSGVVCMIA